MSRYGWSTERGNTLAKTGFPLRTGAAASVRSSARTPMHQRANSAAVMHTPTACCPCLNSTAQPWPLPGCSHSPGTVVTHHEVPFTLPHGAGWWATLALSGNRQHVHNHKGSNRMTHPGTPSQSLLLLFYSRRRHQGMGSDPSPVELSSLGAGWVCRKAMPAGPRDK